MIAAAMSVLPILMLLGIGVAAVLIGAWVDDQRGAGAPPKGRAKE